MAVDNVKLKRLASLFAPYSTLYAVGGYVRDGLLGNDSGDVDVCSKLRVEQVKSILLNSDFTVSDKNLRMGTVHISTKNFTVEYTAFRVDSYDRAGGAHAPDSVRFTDSIEEDARRRDFKCNAVYLDIASGEIVDPLGGVEDIGARVLSAADDPEKVFGADGLRILRLVRFACELGFDIEAETWSAAKRNAWRVKDITAERIRDELNKIFVSDISAKNAAITSNNEDNGIGAAEEANKIFKSYERAKNPASEKQSADPISAEQSVQSDRYVAPHVRGWMLLDGLGLIDILLPEIAALKGVEQKKQYHLYDVYGHTLKAFELSPPDLRWAALLHDAGKPLALARNDGKSMRGHELIGADIARSVLDRFKFSNAEKSRITDIVKYHMTDLRGDMSPHKLRRFAAEHSGIMEGLCDLRDADCEASNGNKPERNTLREAWEEVKKDGTPLCIKQLKVDGNDIGALGAQDRQIGEILKRLWEDTVLNPALNDRDRALEYAKKRLLAMQSAEKYEDKV